MTAKRQLAITALAGLLCMGGVAQAARRKQQPAPAPAPAVPASADKDFNSCAKPGKRAAPVPLQPDTDVAHLITWISSITCQAFVFSDDAGFGRRKLTVVVPTTVTPAHAFRIFLDAMSSVGLTVQPGAGHFYQVIEEYRAKQRPIPLYDFNGHRLVYRAPQHARGAEAPPAQNRGPDGGP